MLKSLRWPAFFIVALIWALPRHFVGWLALAIPVALLVAVGYLGQSETHAAGRIIEIIRTAEGAVFLLVELPGAPLRYMVAAPEVGLGGQGAVGDWLIASGMTSLSYGDAPVFELARVGLARPPVEILTLTDRLPELSPPILFGIAVVICAWHTGFANVSTALLLVLTGGALAWIGLWLGVFEDLIGAPVGLLEYPVILLGMITGFAIGVRQFSFERGGGTVRHLAAGAATMAVHPLLAEMTGLRPEIVMVAALAAFALPTIAQAAFATMAFDAALVLVPQAATAVWLILSVVLLYVHMPALRVLRLRGPGVPSPRSRRADGQFSLEDFIWGMRK